MKHEMNRELRKAPRLLRLTCCRAFLLAMAIHGNAAATTLARMSIDQMSRSAPLIVRVRCTRNSTRWDAGEIWTFTNFEVEETWKGSTSAAIEVRLLGGRLGNLTSNVSGAPRFRPGEEAVLFLEVTARGDFSVMSWAQGTLRVRDDVRTGGEIVTQDTSSIATFDPVTRRYDTQGVRNLPLSAFRARVDSALRAAGGKP